MTHDLDPSDIERFWAKVDRQGDDECWPWTAARLHARGGYGQLRLSTGAAYAHRISYQIEHGEIPDGAWILHKCHNPPCVNPGHLHAGSPKDNAQDAAALGRMGKWDRSGEANPSAKLTERDVVKILDELEGGRSQRDLAVEYNVTQAAISLIARGENWSQVFQEWQKNKPDAAS